MAERVITKNCSHCKTIKPLSDFYKNKSKKSGHQSYCKKCNCDKDSQKKYRQTEKGKIVHRIADKRYDDKYPNRAKAHAVVSYAVRVGKLSRPSVYHCRNCWQLAENYHHHRGYAKEHWFDVLPLCKKCHVKIHRT